MIAAYLSDDYRVMTASRRWGRVIDSAIWYGSQEEDGMQMIMSHAMRDKGAGADKDGVSMKSSQTLNSYPKLDMGKLVQHRLSRCRRNNHFVSRERVHEGLMEADRRHTKAIGRTLLKKSGRRRIRSSPRNPDRCEITLCRKGTSDLYHVCHSYRSLLPGKSPAIRRRWMPLWTFHSSTISRYDMNHVIHKVSIHIDFGGQA